MQTAYIVSILSGLLCVACEDNAQPVGFKERYAAHGLSPKPYDPTIFEVKINRQMFRIPRGYVTDVRTRFNKPIHSGQADDIDLETYWPEFAPFRIEDIAKRAGNAYRIVILLQAPLEGNDAFPVPIGELLARDQWTVVRQDSIGLFQYNRHGPGGGWGSITYLPIDTSYKTPKGDEPFHIACTRDVASDRRPSQCSARYRLKSDILLTYQFHESNLEHWRDLDQKIRSLITSFTGVAQ